MSTGILLHVDVNHCSVGCHLVFAPQLQEKPVVVLSGNDGTAIVVSPKAKLLGFKRGTPLCDLQPWVALFGIVLFSTAFALYVNFEIELFLLGVITL